MIRALLRTVAGRLVVAALLLSAATLLRAWLDQWLANHLPYVTYFVAIAVIAWLTTTPVALVSMIIAWLITDYFFVPPRYDWVFASHEPAYIVGTLAYFAVGSTSIIIAQAMRLAQRRAQLLAAEQARLAAIVESSDDAIMSIDLDGVIQTWNDGAARLYGYSAREAVGQPVRMLMPADRLSEDNYILAQLRRGESIDHHETVRRRKDGTILHILLTMSPIRDAKGAVIGASKIGHDISARKKHEESLALLSRELAHRVKNTLATVQAIAAQTARSSTTLEEFSTALDGRIRALAGAHGLLTRDHWRGASIREVILVALAPFLHWEAGAITSDADDLALTPQQTLAMSMVLHELATNAVKHGALSTTAPPGGAVAIRAGAERGDLHFEWKEEGGPALAGGPPKRRGMGMTLIERIAAYELNGEGGCEFPPEGVVCTIRFPLAAEDDSGTAPQNREAAAPAVRLE